MRAIATSTSLLLAASAAGAHPDHGDATGVGLLHFVTDPFHLVTGALTAGAALLALAAWRAHRRRRAVVKRLR